MSDKINKNLGGVQPIINKLNENINFEIDNKVNDILGKHSFSTPLIKTTLVLSGGAVKGIAHIGALKALEDKHILKNIKVIAGTSIGGLIAGLYVVGWTPDQLYTFIEDFPVKNLRSVNTSGFLTKFGLDDGFKLNFVLERMFEEKNISKTVTFIELYNLTKIKLIVSTVCLNDKQVYYLSYTTYPDMPVLLAIRMTTSLPLWFTPVSYNGKLFVDGGCIDNYPIQLFNNNLDSVIGIYLSENREFVKEINNTEDFLYNLLQCLFEGTTCNSVKGFEKYTVKINLPMVSVINLDINKTIKKQLFDCGYLATLNNNII
jgi:NTE family protein